MYENKKQMLAPVRVYYKRILRNCFWASLILLIMLAIGTAGYYYYSENSLLIDAFHNAAMILSGMGPVLTQPLSFSGKIFSSIYALVSGVIFMSSVGFILAPAIHRIFHRLHLEGK